MRIAVRWGLLLSCVLSCSLLASQAKAGDHPATEPEPPSLLGPGVTTFQSGEKTVKVFRPEEPPTEDSRAKFSNAASHGLSAKTRATTTRGRTSAVNRSLKKQDDGDDAMGEGEAEAEKPQDNSSVLGSKNSCDCNGGCADCGQCNLADDCCTCNCGPQGNFWVRDDNMIWWTRGMRLPPLVIQAPVGTPPVIGPPTTQTLFGGNEVNERSRYGNRIVFGGNLNCCTSWEIDYFALDQQGTSFFNSSLDGNPIIARPFIDANTGAQSSELVGSQGIIIGNVGALATTDFQGAGLMFRSNLACCSCTDSCGDQRCRKIDVIGGYRFYRLDDDVRVRENLVSTNPGGFIPVGTRFDITDSFSTKNEFNGGDLGLAANWFHGCWNLEMLGKVAVGNNHQVVNINGSTTVGVPGQPLVTNRGGLLALPTNIGTYTRDQVAVIPQLETRLGYQWNCHFRTFVGYNFLYWADVARAGEQIDLRVNPSQLPPGNLVGPARPAFAFNDRGFWAQGLSLGAEFRF